MIDLPVNALETLKRLFAKYVPHCEVRAFGSRVKWTSKDYSDLDIAIVCDEPIERKLFNRLKEEIEEIPISFRVDLLDWHKISPEFQSIIEEQYETIYTETSQNRDEWKYYRVDEFAEIVGGGTPKTDIDVYWNGSIPWLTPKDLSGYTNRFISHGERYISAEGLKNSSAKLVPEGTVLLTSRAPVGYVAIAQSEVCTNQGFRSLIPKEGFDSEFIYYLLFHNTEYLKSHATGTTFQELSGGSLKNLSFQIPSFKIQKNIARILGSLDDKIALNREMNKTLEAMAQAIFKSWFVDFEPFKEGEFVESELGMIPKGWEVSSIGAETTSVGGATPSTTNPKFWEDGKFYWATPKDLSGLQEKVLIGTERKITNAGVNKISSGQLPVGTVLLSSRAPIGYLAITTMPVSINQGFIAMVCNKRLPNTYVLQWVTYKLDDIKQRGSGTTFAEISKSTFRPIQVLVPDKESLQKYDEVVRSYYNQIAINIRETLTLSTLRDTLLPKLLSGEIEV